MEFQALVTEYLKHHTARELADYCEAAVMTIVRWSIGFSKPMPGMQAFVTEYIDDLREKEGWDHGEEVL